MVNRCLGCRDQFEARRGAKTCSPRCRKRLQRLNQSGDLQPLAPIGRAPQVHKVGQIIHPHAAISKASAQPVNVGVDSVPRSGVLNGLQTDEHSSRAWGWLIPVMIVHSFAGLSCSNSPWSPLSFPKKRSG